MMLFTTITVRSTALAALAAWFVLPAMAQSAETGMASWYGEPYHGHFAANGELYDMEAMTAAHPTLPFNTVVRVVNLSNDRSVQVRIIDRGPYVDGRIIDVSRAAARSLGLLDSGMDRVRIEVLRAGDPAAPVLVPAVYRPPMPVAIPRVVRGAFAVQAGAFRNADNARRVLARMQTQYGAARLVQDSGSGLWRILVGTEGVRDNAEALAARIRNESGEINAFVVRLDSNNGLEQPGQSNVPGGSVASDALR
jgi:rare lipoprotein A